MFIWPTGYIGPGIIGMINKFSCMIAFHCAMCNINEIFSLTMDIGMHALATTVNTAEGGDKSRIKEGSEVEFFETEPGYVDDVDQQVDIFTLKSGTVSNIDSETGDLTVELSDGTTKIIPSKSATPVTTTPQATAPTTDKKAEPKKVENKHPSEKGKAMSSDIKGKAGEKLSKGGFRKGTDSKTGNNNKDWEYNYEGKPNAGDMTRHTSSGRQYVYKGNGEDEGWQRMYTGWEEQGLTTTATPSTEWLFNPYKSIHYAKSCLCLPAIVYNLEKEKQIKCMQRNCITNRITEGLPTTDCDVAYKERYCLYVEGAEFKKHGYSGFMDNIWEWAKDNSAFLAASLGYVVGCFEYIVAPEGICAVALATGTPAGGWYPSMCGLYGSAMGLMELYTTFASEFSFLNYDQELEGEDYCASGNYQE